MSWISEAAGGISNAATGGAWSTDGKSGFMQGGSGMFEYVPNDIKSAIPGIGDAMAAERQNAMSIAMAREAMKFSERMSSTAYQRGMKDMRKAGLNPMLAFSQGGASAPSGVSAPIASESKTGLGNAAINALGMYGNYTTAKQQANTQQMAAESSIKVNQTTAAKQLADTQKAQVETENLRKEGPRKEVESKMYKKAGQALDYLINEVGSSAKQNSSFARSLDKTFGNMVKGAYRFFNDGEVRPPQKPLTSPRH